MKANTKEWIQYGSAVVMLFSGILLTFLCFFLNHYKVDDSVLWYVAQTLVYAGSIFGVSVYIRSKMGDIKSFIEDKITKNEDDDEKK
jgi:O-antigen/teichoic acid export membrane protein